MKNNQDIIRSDLSGQYKHFWQHFRKLVQDFDPSAWTTVGSTYIKPARISLHILGAAKYYVGAKEFLKFKSGKSFDLEWTTVEEAFLPDQDDVLFAIDFFERQTNDWVTSCSFESENLDFPWCGKSQIGVVVYLLRHSHYHVGELNLLLQISKNGRANDYWDSAME